MAGGTVPWSREAALRLCPSSAHSPFVAATAHNSACSAHIIAASSGRMRRTSGLGSRLTVCALKQTQCTGPMLAWPVDRAVALQRFVAKASECSPSSVKGAAVVGYSTPAVADVGGASIRVAFGVEGLEDHPEAGGWLVGLRRRRSPHNKNCLKVPPNTFLPCLACVPGAYGDRDGKSREGLAELMVMARPARLGSDAPGCSPYTTFVPLEQLRDAFDVGSPMEVCFAKRLTDFFPGLNAGRWLKIRMRQIAEAALNEVARDNNARHNAGEHGTIDVAPEENVLHMMLVGDESDGFNLDLSTVQQPPADKGYLFQHFGNSGNAGVSGQR